MTFVIQSLASTPEALTTSDVMSRIEQSLVQSADLVTEGTIRRFSESDASHCPLCQQDVQEIQLSAIRQGLSELAATRSQEFDDNLKRLSESTFAALSIPETHRGVLDRETIYKLDTRVKEAYS